MDIFLRFFFESIHLKAQPVCLVKAGLFTVKYDTQNSLLLMTIMTLSH